MVGGEVWGGGWEEGGGDGGVRWLWRVRSWVRIAFGGREGEVSFFWGGGLVFGEESEDGGGLMYVP